MGACVCGLVPVGGGVAVGCGMAVGKVCPKGKEHDKIGNVKAIVKRNTLVNKEALISSLLTDRVFQNSQPFDLHNDFISILKFADAGWCTCK